MPAGWSLGSPQPCSPCALRLDARADSAPVAFTCGQLLWVRRLSSFAEHPFRGRQRSSSRAYRCMPPALSCGFHDAGWLATGIDLRSQLAARRSGLRLKRSDSVVFRLMSRASPTTGAGDTSSPSRRQQPRPRTGAVCRSILWPPRLAQGSARTSAPADADDLPIAMPRPVEFRARVTAAYARPHPAIPPALNVNTRTRVPARAVTTLGTH